MVKRSSGIKIYVLCALVLGCSSICRAQYHYEQTSLLKVLSHIEQQTSYTFFYRDALLANVRINLDTDEEHLITVLRDVLKRKKLNLKLDRSRRQAIIYEEKNKSRVRRLSISGQVVDAETGERLPYASIFWQTASVASGISSNESGSFSLDRSFEAPAINLKCSYVGYQPANIRFQLTDSTAIRELTFRLVPTTINGNNVVVTGSNTYGNLSKNTADLVNNSRFSAMGESNTLRALQILPSVSPSPALSGGLHVRGSPTDGVQVLLDNITIFNQSHLFGLIDSFNADALQRSGFYYGIAPAKMEAPTGGTISLLTKTGSLQKVTGKVGLSNSAGRLTLGGPLQKGKSSWLISGRKSFLNTVNWLNNERLVRWGLNVDRKESSLPGGLANFESLLVKPEKTHASFFDLHSKVYFEQENGNRLILSGYVGGDDTRQKAKRLFRSFGNDGGKTNTDNFKYQPVATKNDWQNVAATAQYQQWFDNNIYAATTLGTSIYSTSFSKDDFSYQENQKENQAFQTFIYPFRSKSVLNEWKAKQRFAYHTEQWGWTGGLAYKYYLGEYYENSFDKLGFFSKEKAHKLDAFVQFDYSGLSFARLHAGSRFNYYSNGKYLKWSPRFRLKLFPHAPVSVSGGYSKNYQFLNQLKLTNTVTSNVWILASSQQPPTSVNYYTSGVYFSMSDLFYAQVEAYLKDFNHLRLHELNSYSLSSTYRTNPWFINNSGKSQGVELLTRSKFEWLSLTQTFAISKTTLSNPAVNDGKSFYADWDHTYRYGATLSTHPFDDFSFYLSWIFASGNPGSIATYGASNQRRLSNYRRTDFSVKYQHKLKRSTIRVSASIFNVFDRSNPWYREMKIAVDDRNTPSQFRGSAADVYDIGFQPSFNISVGF